MPRMVEERTVFSTAWFDLIARTIEPSDSSEPYYSLRGKDYVSIVAITRNREIVLVRQYRPAVGKVTLELPAGMVESSEQPEQTARRELLADAVSDNCNWNTAAIPFSSEDPGVSCVENHWILVLRWPALCGPLPRKYANDVESLGFLREAESLIEGKKEPAKFVGQIDDLPPPSP